MPLTIHGPPLTTRIKFSSEEKEHDKVKLSKTWISMGFANLHAANRVAFVVLGFRYLEVSNLATRVWVDECESRLEGRSKKSSLTSWSVISDRINVSKIEVKILRFESLIINEQRERGKCTN